MIVTVSENAIFSAKMKGKFNIIRRPAQDVLSKPLTPIKAGWNTESSAGPGANVEGIVTVKFC